jgi:hypothetical protein
MAHPLVRLACYKPRSAKVHIATGDPPMMYGESTTAYYRSLCGRNDMLADLNGLRFDDYPEDQQCRHCVALAKGEWHA